MYFVRRSYILEGGGKWGNLKYGINDRCLREDGLGSVLTLGDLNSAESRLLEALERNSF